MSDEVKKILDLIRFAAERGHALRLTPEETRVFAEYLEAIGEPA